MEAKAHRTTSVRGHELGAGQTVLIGGEVWTVINTSSVVQMKNEEGEEFGFHPDESFEKIIPESESGSN